MAYLVEITARARRDLDEIYAWVVERAPHSGLRCFDRFEATILSLMNFPERYPVVEGRNRKQASKRLDGDVELFDQCAGL